MKNPVLKLDIHFSNQNQFFLIMDKFYFRLTSCISVVILVNCVSIYVMSSYNSTLRKE